MKHVALAKTGRLHAQQVARTQLMLWGETNPWINTKAKSDQFRKYYPGLTEYFLRAGHCPHDEVPEQVNKLIQEWVSSGNDSKS